VSQFKNVPKKAQFTHERVEYNVFLFDEPLKGSKSLKIFKISLTFRFASCDIYKKSLHTGENSQILSVEQKNIFFRILYSNELYYCTQNRTVIGHFTA
jgi:hypothetical protein